MAETLYNILVHTYHPDKTLRTQAETALESYVTTEPTALVSLLAIVKNREVDSGLRKAATIQVKNKVKLLWPVTDPSKAKGVILTPEIKETIKNEIIMTILDENDNSVRKLLAETFRKLIEYEFPDNWPNLVPNIMSLAQTDNVLRMHNSLLLIRHLAKRFEFKPKEMRGPLNSLITLVFPPLQALMNQIINNNSIEAAQVMKVCLKIFWSSTHYILPIDVPGMDVNFWFHMMASILQKDLPEASSGMEPVGQPIEPEDRAQWPWWKLKKWAFKIMCLFIQRYGNPKVCNEEHVQFAEHFKNNTAKLLLAPVMHMLAQHDKGVFMTDAALRMSLTYVNNCVEMAPTYKLIKPNLDWLLFRVVFKQLCLSDEEMELFNDDPSEFVRKVHDPLEEWTDTRVAAINVLQMLARYRLKDTLPRIMSFISATLIEYAKAPLDPANYRNKDGILVAIGALSSVLRENKTYKVQIEPFMLAHVIPEFTSPVPYLRFRAFWVVEYYDMMKWKSEATFHAILQGCLNGLRDASIPVRTAAATSMKMLFEKPAAHDTIRPILKEIIQEYFNLMEQVDSSTILNVIQSIVMQFGDELYTFAPQMINKIMEQFAEYSAEASADNDADEAAFSACECLETVQHILDVVAEPHPEMLSQIETTLVPIMIGIISNGEQCYEYIESILSIIGFFTYYPDTISPLIWTLCGPLLHALHEWAYDYILEFTTPLLNFISKDVDAFLSLSFEGISHLERLIMICEKALVHDMGVSAHEAKPAAVFLTCLVSSCQNKQLPPTVAAKVMEIVMTRLGKDELARGGSVPDDEGRVVKNVLTVKLLEAAMSVIIYDTPFALGILNANEPATKLLFNQLFMNLPNMDNVGTEKIVVMCFSNLMANFPVTNLPKILQDNLQPMLQQMVREIALIKAGEEAEDEEDGDNEDMEDDDEIDEDGIKAAGKIGMIPEDGFDEDEDCVNVEDESYRDYLNSITSGDKLNHMVYRDGELTGWGDDEDEYQDAALEYVGAYDKVNIVQYFVSAMQVASQKEPAVMETLRNTLEPEDQTNLMTYVQEAAAIANGTV